MTNAENSEAGPKDQKIEMIEQVQHMDCGASEALELSAQGVQLQDQEVASCSSLVNIPIQVERSSSILQEIKVHAIANPSNHMCTKSRNRWTRTAGKEDRKR